MLRKLLRLSNHINVVNSCTFSHNDHYLCTSSWDKSLLLYDVNSGNYRKNGPGLLQGHDGSVSRCIFSSDGSLLASCGYDKNVMLWNPHTLEFIGGLKDDKDWIYDLHLSRNGKTIVTCSKVR
jgi:WD40 repeat protein